MKKKKNRPGHILKQAVSGMQSNKSSIGAYYRKMGGRLGGKGATLATAHKVARIIYKMLLNKTEYRPEIQDENQQNIIQNRIKNLEKQIEKLKKVS